MTKLTIDNQEYDVELTPEQDEIVGNLTTGQHTIALLTHALQCVQAVQQVKTDELKSSLSGE